jgi:hypothetical protein
MLDAVVRSLGTVLDTEDLERVRKAYTIATAYVEVHEIEFSHMQPRRLRTRLAHLLIRLAENGERDCQALSDQAVSALRAPRRSAAELTARPG